MVSTSERTCKESGVSEGISSFYLATAWIAESLARDICRSLRAYTARQLSRHAARVMDGQGLPPAEGRDAQDVFLDLMSQVRRQAGAVTM